MICWYTASRRQTISIKTEQKIKPYAPPTTYLSKTDIYSCKVEGSKASYYKRKPHHYSGTPYHAHHLSVPHLLGYQNRHVHLPQGSSHAPFRPCPAALPSPHRRQQRLRPQQRQRPQLQLRNPEPRPS